MKHSIYPLSICLPILLVLFLWRILIWQSDSFLGFSTRNQEGQDVVRSRSEKWENVKREVRRSQDHEEDSHTWEAAVNPSSRKQQVQRHQCAWTGRTERSSVADGGCACSQPHTLSPDCFLVPVLMIPAFSCSILRETWWLLARRDWPHQRLKVCCQRLGQGRKRKNKKGEGRHGWKKRWRVTRRAG